MNMILRSSVLPVDRRDQIVAYQFFAVRLAHEYPASQPDERNLPLQDPSANRAGLKPQKRGGFVHI